MKTAIDLRPLRKKHNAIELWGQLAFDFAFIWPQRIVCKYMNRFEGTSERWSVKMWRFCFNDAIRLTLRCARFHLLFVVVIFKRPLNRFPSEHFACEPLSQIKKSSEREREARVEKGKNIRSYNYIKLICIFEEWSRRTWSNCVHKLIQLSIAVRLVLSLGIQAIIRMKTGSYSNCNSHFHIECSFLLTILSDFSRLFAI